MAGRPRKNAAAAATEKTTVTPEVMTEPENGSTASAVTENSVKTAASKKKVKTINDFKPDDKILCHSIFPGKMFFSGGASGITYEFVNFGARRYVQYQDLEYGLLLQKTSITSPLIIVDDEELLATDLWADVRRAYNELYNRGDLVKLIKLPAHVFKKEFTALPETVKRTVANIISTQINNNTFDSMSKAKIVDEECGTSLMLMMQG